MIKQSIEEALKQIGLENGDTVLVHSDITPIMNIGKFDSWEDACKLLKSCIVNAIGDSGKFIVPTFNWDFCNGHNYSHDNTESKCGIFSNSVLFDSESVRSLHPIYSFAGYGKGIVNLFSDLSKSSFGEGSVFEKLYIQNAKILFINLNFGLCTFIHFVEQRKKVSYRYLKKFTGIIEYNGKSYTDTYDFFVRDLDIKTTKDGTGYLYVSRLGEYLISERRYKQSDPIK